MAISKVVSSEIKRNKDGDQNSYSSQFGTMYCTIVTLEDGTKGEVSSKKAGIAWEPGTVVEYKYTAPNDQKYPGKLSLSKPKDGAGYSGGGNNAPQSPSGPSGGSQRSGYDVVGPEIGHAITSAISLLSVGAKAMPTIEQLKEKAREVLAMSDELKAERRAAQGTTAAHAPAPAAPAAGKPKAKPVLTAELKATFIERVKNADPTATMEALAGYYDIPQDMLGEIATAILLSAPKRKDTAPAPAAQIPDEVENLPF
jgi:hypothetical protein